MRFTWHATKAETNVRKHGISFQVAARAFADPFALSDQDRIEDGEQRWQTIGLVEGHLLVLVAHITGDTGDNDEVIHIISARRADRTERKRYEEERR